MEDQGEINNDEQDQTYTDMADTDAHGPCDAAERTRNFMWSMNRDLEQDLQQIQNRNDIDESEKRRLTNTILNRPGQEATGWDVPLEMYDVEQVDDELEDEQQQQQQNQDHQAQQQMDIANHNTDNSPNNILGEFRFALDDEQLVRRVREEIRQWGAAQFLWDMSNPQDHQHDQPIDHNQQHTVNPTNNLPHSNLEGEREREEPHIQTMDNGLEEQQLQVQDNKMNEYVNNQHTVARHIDILPDNDYKHALTFDDEEIMRKIRQSARDGTMIQFKWVREDAERKPHHQDDNGEGSSKQ
jgi:hypothetical protein